MGDKIDKLALGYDVFFAEMEVPVPSDQQIKFRIATTYKWGEAEAKMTLQLVLKAGQVLETGTGKKIILGKEKINLDASELGGWQAAGVSKYQPHKANLPASCGELTPKEIRYLSLS